MATGGRLRNENTAAPEKGAAVFFVGYARRWGIKAGYMTTVIFLLTKN
jgi:hypothetical protein